MKHQKLTILLLSLLFLVSLDAIAQTKVDQVLMVNGELKEGHVTGIMDDGIEFVHEGESLKYTLKKVNISKIEFASGRIEVFNEMPAKTGSEKGVNLVDHHNKVAILPFVYIRDGSQNKNDAMERKAQQEFYALMNGHVGIMKIQDVNTTNATLSKNGVTDDNFVNFTIPEIANMLGVEYIVQSNLSISMEGSSTYASSYGALQKKNNNRITASSANSSSTSLRFQTNVDMMLYNDQGSPIWSQSKESFWPTEDAYKQTLKFLLKRMPIYQK